MSNDPRETAPHAADDVESAKHSARMRAREARCALDAAVCRAATGAAAERLVALPAFATARLVLAYGASVEEIDPAPAVTLLRQRGIAIAYPRVEAPGELGLHLIARPADLVAGMFGIREPAADAPRVSPAAVDAVIVPGVAFDEGCWRLGYGGGYYDRLLALLRPECARVGLAYDEQLLPEIPSADHDVRLDAVVTPTRVIVRA
ncbi:MAG: 5-formyltetrahydrofolate cyclo-ligase [Coriobacteriia bacterium]|nr:5-formyltetrahydrofolate cyclo-ligase [Coriobacteriia bacterium]